MAVLEVTVQAAIRQLHDELGLTLRDIAAALGVDVRTVKSWEGRSHPQLAQQEALNRLLDLMHALRREFPSVVAARTWLETRNPYLANVPPIVLVRGRYVAAVSQALQAFEDGGVGV